MTTIADKSQNKPITFIPKGFTRNKVEEMAAYYGRNTSAQIIECINFAYSEFKKEALGYHTGSMTQAKKGKKAAREATIEAWSAMGATAHMLQFELAKLGYPFPKRETNPDNDLMLLTEYLAQGRDGRPALWRLNQMKADGSEVERYEVLTFDQLIADLRAKKLI